MRERTRLAGLDFDRLTRAELIELVEENVRGGHGGTIVTPNIDICRLTRRDPRCRELVAATSVVVPDGMPLLWAARLARQPLVERITGAELIFSLARSAAASGWPVYLIGGLPAGDGRASVAELAGQRLREGFPGLAVAGACAPPERFDPEADDVGPMREDLAATEPKIVFVGLGFPKQEWLIARLAPDLPGAWFLGCGAAIPFAAGVLRRAPTWMQRCGLEWAFRLLSEPRRLFRRYLIDDLPFAARLLAGCAWRRFTGRGTDDQLATAAQPPGCTAAQPPGSASRVSN
jgi:N-acetylglucosaminyldiphosphoundecaprenol N-acetyl-beta-D-mannosaminyltransferase